MACAVDRATLELRALAKLELLKRREPLTDFVPRVSPALDSPRHLAAYAALLERTQREQVFAVIAAPPQHGKTELTKHFLLWSLRRNPRKRNGYVSYSSTRAETVSREIQRTCPFADISFTGTLENWTLPEGGGLITTGIGGGLTGYPIDGTLVIDDPFKNREEADSAHMREHHHGWFTSTAMTRVHPGTSIIIMATRWHPDDLSGRLIAEGWESINLPAIDAEGHALWEERRPKAWLEEKRRIIGEYDWNALYQGQPRSRGASVFKDPTYYTKAPTAGFKVTIGADFAYSSKTYADYSVAVVIASANDHHFILDVVRKQADAPQFAATLKELQDKHRGHVHAYIGGTELGIVDFMKREGVKVSTMPASADKFTRAQGAAAAWNCGRIMVPQTIAATGARIGSPYREMGILSEEKSQQPPPWLDAFTSEVTSFTGVKDRHDDQVDALAGAFIPYAKPRAVRLAEGAGW